MMLSLLSALSLSAPSIHAEDPAENGGLFDLRFTDEDYNDHTMTHNNEGVYVGLRVHDTLEQPGRVTTISPKENPKTYNEVKVEYKPGYTRGHRVFYFICENTAFVSKFVDLGVFANPDFDGNDNTQVAMRSDRNGFTVTDIDTNLIYTVLCKGTFYRDADTIYLGNLGDTQTQTHESLPFFNNLNNGETPAGDHYAFSWTNVLLKPGQKVELGYVIEPSNNVNLPPALRETTEKKESYPKNQDIELTFKVFNFNPGQQITFEFSVDYEDQGSQTKAIPDNGSAVTFTTNVNLGDNDQISYEAVITIDDTYVSNKIRGTITAEGARAPKFVIDSDIEERIRSTTYEPGDEIEIRGTVTDDSGSSIKYRFDYYSDGTTDSKFSMSTKGTKRYESSIQIPTDFGDGQYPFHIWAEDDLGKQSEPIKFQITIQTPPEPKVKSAYFSRYKADPNETLIVFGEVTDPNSDDELTIYAKFDKDERVEIGKKTPNSQLASFAYFLKVPEDKEVGMHNITIEAKDSNEHEATEVVTKVIEITDPSSVRTQELRGNVTDETEKLDSKKSSCFDIFYKKTGDGNGKSTSYNYEGYYVGFRTYDEGRPSETQLIKHTEGSKAQLENFSITQRTEYDPVTGYLQVIFDVQNTDYWSKTIDLGVFVDTQLNGNNDGDGIKLRNDGRGVTISDKSSGIFMTFFLLDYGSFPNVDTIFLDEIDNIRRSNDELDVSNIPFFRTSNTKESKGNAMLSFSWLKREIMPDTNVSFGFTIAPDSNIKTPTRIVDETDLAFASKNENINLKFRIIDGDVGENVAVNLDLNGKTEQLDVQILDKDKGMSITREVNTGDGKYYSYSVSARDKDVKFTSKTIDVKLPLSKSPIIGFDPTMLKKNYVVNQTITISGWAEDETGGKIKYRFNNGREHIADKFLKEGDGSRIVYNYNQEVPIPEQLIPGKSYDLSVWAEDDAGIQSTKKETYKFHYDLPVHPHLIKAGLNKKVAHAGDKILGYVLADINSTNTELLIYAKFGKDDFKPVGQPFKKSKRSPNAFFYEVPSNAKPGDYEIIFRVEDMSSLQSENISQTLTIVDK